MNSQQLLYINIVIGVVFVVYFLLGRGKGRQPTRLNVKANEDFSKTLLKTSQTESQVDSTEEAEPSYQISKKAILLEPEHETDTANSTHETSKTSEAIKSSESSENVVSIKSFKAKNLSIYFVYNGHEWESHEVLGVPQGAPLPKVTAAYQELIKTSDPSTFEFFESAYQSILMRWRDRL